MRVNGNSLLDKTINGSIVDENGCWVWQGQLNPDGYALMWVGGKGGKYRKAHRVSFQVWNGKLQKGLTIDHTCFNRACVNPEHLEQVTRAENTMRALRKRYQTLKKRCPQGHPYNAENTYVLPSRPRARYCRTCQRVRSRDRKRILRAQRKLLNV